MEDDTSELVVKLMISNAALCRLLLAKGVISQEELDITVEDVIKSFSKQANKAGE